VIDKIVRHSEEIMTFIGMDVQEFQDGLYRRRLGVMGSNGVTIGAPCNGLVLFALFVVFVLAFPGSWKHKMWFLPTGVIGIHVMNCFRVIALAVIFDYNPDWLEFNHDYTFTIIVYSFVFLLWYIYVNGLSSIPKKVDASPAAS
ncbi:MAG: archaeosortase/exosortase family protein, partial [Bacteroidota bacterium]